MNRNKAAQNKSHTEPKKGSIQKNKNQKMKKKQKVTQKKRKTAKAADGVWVALHIDGP